MLTEFAFTPWVFDEACQPNVDAWLDQLQELAAGMFPRNMGSPVFIANLADGSWFDAVMRMASNCRDHRGRQKLQCLFSKMRDSLVDRPRQTSQLKYSETAWAEEAVDSARSELIERIVTSPAMCTASLRHGSVYGIPEVLRDSFWKDVSPEWSPPMTLAEQVRSLRKLAVHANFLCLVLPYIKGGDNDEGNFACELVKSAFRRPPGFGQVEFEIHTAYSKKGDRPANREQVNGWIRQSLQKSLRQGQEVRLFVWEKLRERYLIAGRRTELADGQITRAPRWGMYFGHIATKRDRDSRDSPTEWKLLNAESLRKQFDRYCRNDVTGYLHDEVVIGVCP